MKKYNKLVRDRIPEIIETDGKKSVFHILTDEEYLIQLEKKLDEEIQEYHQDHNLEEMADVLEVLYSICEARGYTIDELEAKRTEKAINRGRFKEKIFLEYVD